MNKKGIKLEDIVELYSSGLTPIQISEKLNCTCENITRRLRRAGITVIRDYSKGRYSRFGRHKLNEHFFDDINTEESAYFLGLMFADGSVTKNQFYLKMIDEHIIQKFKEVLQSSVNIQIRNKGKKMVNNAYVLTISSKSMCQKLSEWGCTPNKTYTIRFPNIKEEFYSHFLRGFFDGDGCLQLQDKICRCRFDLTSASKKFLEDVRPIISLHSKSNGHLGKEKKYDVWHLNYSGHQVKQILDWLYKDATIYLTRKYNKYLLLGSL